MAGTAAAYFLLLVGGVFELEMDESYSITSMKGLVCAEERSEVYGSR